MNLFLFLIDNIFSKDADFKISNSTIVNLSKLVFNQTKSERYVFEFLKQINQILF
jgi:hypothetical protein